MAKNYSQDDLGQLRAELAALREKMGEQSEVIEQQAIRLVQLETRQSGPDFTSNIKIENEKPTSRRRMLKKLAAGAAFAAAATSALATTEQAQADNTAGNSITVSANDFYGIIAAPRLVTQTPPPDGSFGLIGSGASSVASGISAGVQGNSGAPGGYGVQGNAGGAGGTGVQGNAPGGIGVQGTTSGNIAVQGISSSQGIGVQGVSNSQGIGVEGKAQTGVQGISTDPTASGGTGVTGDGGAGGTKGTGVAGKGITGIYGLSKASGGRGVFGEININGPADGSGVHGLAASANGGIGVFGETGDNTPTSAISPNTAGVYGRSKQGYGGKFDGGVAPLLLFSSNVAGAPTTLKHYKGELYVDSDGKLYYCSQDGTPGNWGQLSPLVFLNKPIRLLGSPNSFYNNTGGAFIPGGPSNAKYFAVDGQIINDASGEFSAYSDVIPGNISGVFGSVVVFDAPGGGYLTIFPGDKTAPAISTVTYAGNGAFTSSFFSVKTAVIPAPRDYNGRTGIGIAAFTNCRISLDIVGYYL